MRLIDADDVIKLLEEEDTGDWDWDNGYNTTVYWISNELNKIPEINPLYALGICQCKDCIHFRHNNENEPYCKNRYGLSDPKETDYCPYAKRKGNNNV